MKVESEIKICIFFKIYKIHQPFLSDTVESTIWNLEYQEILPTYFFVNFNFNLFFFHR